MPGYRYNFRTEFINDEPAYEEQFKKRNLKWIHQYETPLFISPSLEEIATLTTIPHTWTIGSRYFKLAHKHYGNSEYWWVIALFNKKPTESHVTLGDVIYVPLPLPLALDVLGVG